MKKAIKLVILIAGIKYVFDHTKIKVKGSD